MKIELSKIDDVLDDTKHWMWLLHADNGARLCHGVARRRRDCIAQALLVLGLSLPKRTKGSIAEQVRNLAQRRGGTADVWVAYGAGGQVRLAQWKTSGGDFIEMVEVAP